MNPFQYTRSLAVTGAIQSLMKEPHAHFLAGGTNLIDLMKMGVVLPDRLVDINATAAERHRKDGRRTAYRGAGDE